MPDREAFDLLPRTFFEGLRERMLLGMIPSETVERILEPVLEDYEELTPLLPPGLRNDLEDILRIYPEVARNHGLAPGAGFFAVLVSLWDFLRETLVRGEFPSKRRVADAWPEDACLTADIAGENQRPLNPSGAAGGRRTGGSLITDAGKEIFLVLSCPESGDAICFESPGITRTIEVRLCGRPVMSLSPEASRRSLSVPELAEKLRGVENRDLEVEIVERRG